MKRSLKLVTPTLVVVLFLVAGMTGDSTWSLCQTKNGEPVCLDIV